MVVCEFTTATIREQPKHGRPPRGSAVLVTITPSVPDAKESSAAVVSSTTCACPSVAVVP